MLIARFENQYSHQIEKTQSRLLSSKKDRDNHGYGLQSIGMIVSKYNGEMDIKTENSAFILTVIIPA